MSASVLRKIADLTVRVSRLYFWPLRHSLRTKALEELAFCPRTGKPKRRFLVQVMNDPYFVHKTFLALSVFRRRYCIDVDAIETFEPYQLKKPARRLSWLRRIFNDNTLSKSIWLSHYRFLRYGRFYSIASREYVLEAAPGRFTDVAELLGFSINGIPVGDLIYDTYLRFKESPTVDLGDPDLACFVEQARQIHGFVTQVLDSSPYDALITTYTSYIYHGILSRLALQRGIPVYALGNSQQLLIRVKPDFPYHVRDFRTYASRSCGPEDLARADALLRGRLSGAIDSATKYMGTSAFAGVDESFSLEGHPAILIMGHDFFDSPHIYRWILFPDFYCWLHFVFSQAAKSPYKFYYKPHPNEIGASGEILQRLRSRFPDIVFLPKQTSNQTLLKAGFRIVLTVYGTVAHEFPYQGVPVIACGDNPHSSYSFNTCASTPEELEAYLTGAKTPPSVGNSMAEIQHFYFQHNLAESELRFREDLAFRSNYKYFRSWQELEQHVLANRAAYQEFLAQYPVSASDFEL